jgi:hypothetical protein
MITNVSSHRPCTAWASLEGKPPSRESLLQALGITSDDDWHSTDHLWKALCYLRENWICAPETFRRYLWDVRICLEDAQASAWELILQNLRGTRDEE